MRICFYDKKGVRHCYYIPYVVIPFPPIPHFPIPPQNYEALIWDVTVLASLSHAATLIKDENVRKALDAGLSASFKAAQQHAGEDVTIDVSTAR